MDSKENSLIEVKETFWGKVVNSVKSFFSGIFSRREKDVEEISSDFDTNTSEVFSNTDNSLNSIVAEHIEVPNNTQNTDTNEIVEPELSLQEKLEKLIKENQELTVTLNNKIEELKKIRIKELKITLDIYKIEEMYLKKIKSEKLKV